jgi:hypothetical protein
MLVSWVLHLRLCHMAPVKAKSILQEMWFFCTLRHKVPLVCFWNLAPMVYSFEANYQLIWEPILCKLHIESRTVLYTSLAEKAHHFHGAFALSVRFWSKSSQSRCACNSLHWLNLILKEIVMYVSLLTHCGQMNWIDTCNYIFLDTSFLSQDLYFQFSNTFSTDWRTFSSCSLQMPAYMFDLWD